MTPLCLTARLTRSLFGSRPLQRKGRAPRAPGQRER
jgi:hypothetical protein